MIKMFAIDLYFVQISQTMYQHKQKTWFLKDMK